jgi:hypothetical protein
MHMAAVDLASPTIADFDLAITSRCSVADDEVISKAILHAPDMPMIIIENACVALSRAAIVHDNELPATPFHRRTPDRFDN